MGAFASRQVILLSFPFSDLSASKLRPALVLATSGKDDWVLCQITSNPFSDIRAVEIKGSDFVAGGLQRVSYARPGKLFTAHESLFQRAAGRLAEERHGEIVEAVVRLLREGASS